MAKGVSILDSVYRQRDSRLRNPAPLTSMEQLSPLLPRKTKTHSPASLWLQTAEAGAGSRWNSAYTAVLRVPALSFPETNSLCESPEKPVFSLLKATPRDRRTSYRASPPRWFRFRHRGPRKKFAEGTTGFQARNRCSNSTPIRRSNNMPALPPPSRRRMGRVHACPFLHRPPSSSKRPNRQFFKNRMPAVSCTGRHLPPWY